MRGDWRQILLYLTVMGMEGSAFYVVLAVFNRQVAADRLTIAGVLLIYPLAFTVNKILRAFKLRPIFSHAINVPAWLIALLLTAKIQFFSQSAIWDSAWLAAFWQNLGGRAELILLFGSIALWFTGRRLARIGIDFATAVGEFQFTLAVLLLTLFATSQLNIEVAGGVPVIIVFAISSLLAMSLSHAKDGTGWLSGLNQGHWAGLLLVSIGLVLVLGLLVSAALTPDFLQVIIDGLKWVWNKIWTAIYYLNSLLPTPSGEPIPLPPPETAAEAETEKVMRELIPDSIREPLRIAWVILASGAMLAALWRISTQIADWLRRRMSGKSQGELESLKGAFGADILAFFKRILAKLFRWRGLHPQAVPENIHPVRRIYREFLKWAGKQGLPRSPFQTPYEYLLTLEEALPSASAEFGLITRQYVSTRYGAIAPSEADLDRLKQTWQRLQKENLKPADK
ncbi:MAG: DUF4129 domain-containing protein [Dehalococcoidales bacterium]|nr:DUF4129 domain-containing protein [Dehalococcoidales bacterium]